MDRSSATSESVLSGKRVVIIGPVPEVGFDVPGTLARGLWFHSPMQIAPSRGAFLARQEFVLETFAALHREFAFDLVQPSETLCDAARCNIDEAGRPLYVDDNHLSVSGARLLIPQFRQALQTGAAATRSVTL